MKNKQYIVAAVFFAILAVGGIGGFLFLRGSDSSGKVLQPDRTNANTQTTISASPTADKSKTFTLDELARHSTDKDCYVAYGGQVFDITWFIPRHEGGNQIVGVCGSATDDFSKIHPGGPFTKRAIQAILQMSVVGTLAQ